MKMVPEEIDLDDLDLMPLDAAIVALQKAQASLPTDATDVKFYVYSDNACGFYIKYMRPETDQDRKQEEEARIFQEMREREHLAVLKAKYEK